MAPATITVVYPQGGKFDMDYYKSTHMPLVQKKWSSHGLTSCKPTTLLVPTQEAANVNANDRLTLSSYYREGRQTQR